MELVQGIIGDSGVADIKYQRESWQEGVGAPGYDVKGLDVLSGYRSASLDLNLGAVMVDVYENMNFWAHDVTSVPRVPRRCGHLSLSGECDVGDNMSTYAGETDLKTRSCVSGHVSRTRT